MLDMIVWLAVAFLACVGFVQAAGYLAVRSARKKQRVYRVFPVRGDSREAGRQMALYYTGLQWEANPMRQIFVFYDAGLEKGAAEECEKLARETGGLFVRTPEELVELFHKGVDADHLQPADSVL